MKTTLSLPLSGHLDRWLLDSLRNADPFLSFWDFPGRSTAQRRPRPTHLPADLYEGKDSYHAVYELPGVAKKDVTVALEGAVLRVSGTYAPPFADLAAGEGGEEPAPLEFRRSLAVPEDVDSSAIRAEMKDGLLRLTLPRKEELKPRTISVQ